MEITQFQRDLDLDEDTLLLLKNAMTSCDNGDSDGDQFLTALLSDLEEESSSSSSANSSLYSTTAPISSSTNISKSDGVKRNEKALSAARLRRQQHIKRIRTTFCRLVKNDVRKLFPTMYCNVINGGDMKMLDEFASRYFRPDCELISHSMPDFGLPMLCYNSRSEYLNHVEMVLADLPDFTMCPIGGQIIRQLHENVSIIELFADFSATRLLPPVSNSGDETAAVRRKTLVCFDITFPGSRPVAMLFHCGGLPCFIMRNQHRPAERSSGEE
eukprot:scaffold211_cov168-Ochromonas_danica.AAC.9